MGISLRHIFSRFFNSQAPQYKQDLLTDFIEPNPRARPSVVAVFPVYSFLLKSLLQISSICPNIISLKLRRISHQALLNRQETKKLARPGRILKRRLTSPSFKSFAHHYQAGFKVTQIVFATVITSLRVYEFIETISKTTQHFPLSES